MTQRRRVREEEDLKMFPRFLAVGEWRCQFLKSGRAQFTEVKGKRPLSLGPVS